MPPRINCGHVRPDSGRCLECRAQRMRNARKADPTRHILVLMIQRCHNPKHPRFELYGGRGIAVCDEWRDKTNGYARFLAHAGPRPSGKHSIDRIDNDLSYQPGNVRWATQAEQMNNTRRNRKFVVDGKTQTLTQLERESGLTNLSYRLASGKTIEAALALPVGLNRRLIEHNGQTKNATEWSVALGGCPALVCERIAAGWSEQEAVSTPPGVRRSKGSAA